MLTGDVPSYSTTFRDRGTLKLFPTHWREITLTNDYNKLEYFTYKHTWLSKTPALSTTQTTTMLKKVTDYINSMHNEGSSF